MIVYGCWYCGVSRGGHDDGCPLGREPGPITMQTVCRALEQVYEDDGIAIWLSAEHSAGKFKGRRPIDVCRTAEGRYEVFALVEALADGAFL